MSVLPGVYRARVVDRDDPEAAGRLKVMVPEVGDAPAWAMPCLPLVTSIGETPLEAEFVWVMFEAGDPRMPVVVGVLPI